MDHGGHFEKDSSIMSQVQLCGGVDLCDNLSTSETLAALSQNLNDATSLTQAQSLSLRQEAAGEARESVQKAFLGGNEEAAGKVVDPGGDGEDEDVDEEMIEEEEEEISEGSSVLIRCQSPDTPMTDSSYSETGSLLETPYPFSPGTSPEPTSPVLPPISPEVSCTTSLEALSPGYVKVDSNTSVASIPGSTTLEQSPGVTSCTAAPCPLGPTDAPHNADCLTFISGEHLTSSNAGQTTSAAETPAATSRTTSPPSSTTYTAVCAATAGLETSAAESTGIKSSSFAGPVTSTCIHYTSKPEHTGSSSSAGPVGSSALLEFLQQLAQRGDDVHLPQHLHQIAETFVLNGDYQRALWCIQLQRLYHQRVLDNLNALQQQWESQCRRSIPDLATTHLDTLKRICQTHSRPRAEHSPCASLDPLMSISEDRVEGLPCSAAHYMSEETPTEDFSHLERNCAVLPSHDSAGELDSPDTSEQKRDHRGAQPDGRSRFHGSHLTCTHGGDGGGGHVPSATGSDPHPPASGRMEQSKSAEQQGGDAGRAQGSAAKEEAEESVREEETPTAASGMEDEGEDEAEDKVKGEDSSSVKAEPQVRAADVKEQQLLQEARAEEDLHMDSQENPRSLLSEEAHPRGEEEDEEEDGQEEEEEEEEEQYEVEQAPSVEAASLDDMAKLITVEEMSPASGLVSILKKRGVSVDDSSVAAGSEPPAANPPPKRRVHFKVPDDGYEHEVGGGDSCLLLFLLCLVTVVISLGGTALYCALGDAHSSVCKDFSRNADFYVGQIQSGISHIRHWFSSGS